MASSCQIGPFPSEGRSSSCSALKGVECKSMHKCSRRRSRLSYKQTETTASSCQSDPFPSEGRSSSCFALKGVKCKSMQKCSRSSARLQDGLLRRHATGSTSGRPYAVFGRDKRLKVSKPTTARLALTTAAFMSLIQVGASLTLEQCVFTLNELLTHDNLKLGHARIADKAAARELSGHYVDCPEHTAADSFIGDGKIEYKATKSYRYMKPTDYKVRSLSIKGKRSTVIEAKDAQKITWFVLPVKVGVLIPEGSPSIAKLAFFQGNASGSMILTKKTKYFYYPDPAGMGPAIDANVSENGGTTTEHSNGSESEGVPSAAGNRSPNQRRPPMSQRRQSIRNFEAMKAMERLAAARQVFESHAIHTEMMCDMWICQSNECKIAGDVVFIKHGDRTIGKLIIPMSKVPPGFMGEFGQSNAPSHKDCSRCGAFMEEATYTFAVGERHSELVRGEFYLNEK